jgi:hypothetical protein
LDSSKNIKKKDYTHIKSVLDSAILSYVQQGGEITVKKIKNHAPCFGHKTDFCCIQQPNGSLSDGFYVINLMLEYRRDRRKLHMSRRHRYSAMGQETKKCTGSSTSRGVLSHPA